MARDFHVSVRHALSQETAQRRIQMLLSETQSLLADPTANLNGQWEGNECDFRLKIGVLPFQGTVRVDESKVRVDGKLPWGTGRYAPRAEKLVAERLKALLDVGERPPKGNGPPDPPLRLVRPEEPGAG